ncbi:MAG: hypothetical protein U9R38_03170 [Candidatus Margulisiibacteriota bacterium]|nr:hypothetical protein [Candidatus Margulisiibacteriota bacterium]
MRKKPATWQCFKSYPHRFKVRLLGNSNNPEMLRANPELIERFSDAVLKNFEARTETLTIEIQASLLASPRNFNLVLKGLANNRDDHYNGMLPIADKAFSHFPNREVSREMTVRFRMREQDEVSMDITRRTFDGIVERVTGFIIESPDKSRIGTIPRVSMEAKKDIAGATSAVLQRMVELGMIPK